MADTRGVFNLKNIRNDILSDEGVSLNDVWFNYSPENTSNIGYYAGGLLSGGRISTVDKVDFTSDTGSSADSLANLPNARSGQGAVSNSTHGYFAGGLDDGSPGYQSSTSKLEYSSETSSPVPAAPLSSQRNILSATGNSVSAYFAGGGNPGRFTSVDKFFYNTDTIQQIPSASLPYARDGLGGDTSGSASYFAGGFDGSNSLSSMEKISFNTDEISVVTGGELTIPRRNFGSSGTGGAGYFGGGTGAALYSTIDKISYAVNTMEAASTLTTQRYGLSATGNSTHGYFAGGRTPPYASLVDKLTYSNDNRTHLPSLGSLRRESQFHAAVCARNDGLPSSLEVASKRWKDNLVEYTTAARFMSGNNIEKYPFSTETYSILPQLDSGGNLNSGISSPSSGYCAFGSNPAKTYTCRIYYSSDTNTVVPSANLSGARNSFRSLTTESKGYFIGGHNYFGNGGRCDKITYATDVTEHVPGADVPGRSYPRGAGGNSTQGYFSGGYSPQISTTTKTTYSTDSSALAPSSNLLEAAYNGDAFANSNYVYFCAGTENPGFMSSITRITNSNGTVTRIPATFSIASDETAATAGSSSGYFNVKGTILEKVSYSTETVSSATPLSRTAVTSACPLEDALPSSGFPTEVPRTEASRQTATSTRATAATTVTASVSSVANNAYTFAGINPSSTGVEKIDYSTDTASLITGASVGNWNQGSSTSNSQSTYFTGSLGGYSTNVSKISYATLIGNLLPGTLSNNRGYNASVGNTTQGYFTTGAAFPSTNVDKITYSTDNIQLVPTAQDSTKRNQNGAAGDSTHGYFGGGYSPAVSGPTTDRNLSTIDKLTYSTDTKERMPSSSLNIGRSYVRAAGNSTHGYFGPGRNPAYFSFVDKIAYSTGTVTTFNSNVYERYGYDATGNGTAGYFGGGYLNSVGYTSIVEKITYSSDTTSTSATQLINPRYLHNATSPLSNAMPSSAQVSYGAPTFV